MSGKNSKRLRVLIVAPSMRHIGGQSVQARCLLDELAGDSRIEASFLPNDPELEIFAFLQKIKFARTFFTSLKFWRLLLASVRRHDIIHIFSAGMTGYVVSTLPPLFAARLCGKKTILHYHSGEAERHFKTWRRTALSTARLFDKIVVPSQFLVEVFARFDLKAESVFNFVETGKFVFRRRQPLAPAFLSNRNFEAHYRVADCLRAFQIIERKYPGAQLIVAGSGGEKNELEALAALLRLKNVKFVGRVERSEMPSLYERADIYLNSSVVDNMPLSIIEAQMCGLPVVSTNAGGIPFIVADGETGLLAAVGDFQELAEKAIRLLENQEEAQRIIENARAAAEKYAPEKIKEKWIEIYRRIFFGGEEKEK